MEQANVDLIHREGKGKLSYQGSVAHKLLANDFDVNGLRTNDTLLYDEWKAIDTAVIKEAQQRLNAVNMLIGRGLTYNIPNGLSKTVLAYQDMSDIEEAEVNMDGISKGRRDRPEYDISYLPLPIFHKDFSFTAREIAASRNGNMPLDTSMAELATRKVSEKIEEFVVVGSSNYTFGGGTIYGLLDAPNRNTGNLTAHWNDSAASGTTIKTDVLDMKQELIDDRFYGPYGVWIPTAFETPLDDDYTTGYPKTIRSRLAEIAGVDNVTVVDTMTADNVVMFQLSSDVVRIVIGLSIVTVEWDSEGGLRHNFKVMAIMVPQVRYTQALRSGIAHYS